MRRWLPMLIFTLWSAHAWADVQTAPPYPPQANTLEPHGARLEATPAEKIPVALLKAPAGFKVELWATGLPNGRSMTISPAGTVFVGSRFVGKVYAVIDRGDHREVKVIASDLHRPNGVTFRDGTLYVAEVSRILRFDHIEEQLDHPPAPVVIYDALPKDEPHGWKFLTISPDGRYLYFGIGSPGNILLPPPTHATINRLDLKTNTLEVVAHGVRNTVGMAFHPVTHELWFTHLARDWLSDDLPNDTLNRLSENGQDFGFPYCHQGNLPDPQFGVGHSCAGYAQPVLNLGPHVASLGMRFYTGTQFPAQYRNNIFIADHGSWNRSQKTGFDVTRVVLDDQGHALALEPFVTGWLQGDNTFWGRPADVEVYKDGSLLVSDDWNGAIFRVSTTQP